LVHGIQENFQHRIPGQLPPQSPVDLILPAVQIELAQFRPRGLENALNPATVLLTDVPVVAEQEPNDTSSS
jgi:hypothetical protein